jgi:hypothetical protein
MGHTFDTGLAKPQRTLIREALIARLGADRKLSRYVVAVKPLPRTVRGEGDGDGLAMLQATLGAKAPALLIALGHKRTEALADPLENHGELEVVIYVASAHSRDLVDGRLAGDGVSASNLEADPGIEVALEHVEECVLGQALGIAGVKELRQTEEDEVATFAEFTVWFQRYTVEVERVIDPNRDETILVTSIEGRHRESGTSDVPDDSAPQITPITTIANLDPETP